MWVLTESCFIKGEEVSGTEGTILLPNLKSLYCDSAIRPCRRLQTASLSTTDTSSTTGPDKSLGLRHRVAYTSTSARDHSTALSCSKSHSKLTTSQQANKYLGAKLPTAFYAASKIQKKRPTKCCVSFFVIGDSR